MKHYKYHYLNNSSWSEITRDERTFCMYLYNAFREDPAKLVEIITSVESPYKHKNFEKKLKFKGEKWELGYEVCFYRDLLFSYKKPIKQHYEDLIEKGKLDNPEKLIKRTFDLCLFSEKEIVIIEAKAHEPFSRSQFKDIECDWEYINRLFDFLDIKDIPNIYLVALASSHYYKSPSFKRDNGVAKNFLLDKSVADCLISWKQIAIDSKFPDNHEFEREMLNKADSVYKRKPEKVSKSPTTSG